MNWLTCRRSIYDIAFLFYNGIEWTVRHEVRCGKYHRCAIIQCHHDRNGRTVSMKEWIIYTNSRWNFIEFQSFACLHTQRKFLVKHKIENWAGGGVWETWKRIICIYTNIHTHIKTVVDQTEVTIASCLWSPCRAWRELYCSDARVGRNCWL